MQKVFDTVEEFWTIKDFNKIKLPKKTFRDKITKIYLDVFKSKKNLGVSLYNFEKEYKKLERL